MSRSPHDALFQFTFQQVEHAAGLFRSILPPALAQAIDWGSLALRPGSQVDRRLRRHQSDLLFTAQIGAGTVWLYLLVEHKARSERWAVLQLLGYVLGLWQELRRQRPRPRQLPLVVPILLHHGRRPWSGPRRLADLLAGADLAAGLQSELLPLQPAFRPLLISIDQWPPERIRGMALTVFGKLTIEALQQLPSVPFTVAAAVIRRWSDLVRELAATPSATEALTALWTYVLDTARGRPEPVIEVVDEVLEAANMSKRMTAGAILRAEGKAEGKAEARTELLLRLLAARFGGVPAALQARIAHASAAQIEGWAVRVLDARSPDDVFAD